MRFPNTTYISLITPTPFSYRRLGLTGIARLSSNDLAQFKFRQMKQPFRFSFVTEVIKSHDDATV